MIEAGLATMSRDREVDARVIQHPFGIVCLYDSGLRCKQRRIEADRLGKILDSDVNMYALHDVVSFFRLRAFAGVQVVGAQGSGAPWQQFSVRYPSSAFMVSNRAA